MTMFDGYAHMVDFITSFEWKTNPHDELVSRGDYCLAQPGEIYAAYLPRGGAVTVQLEPRQLHGNLVQCVHRGENCIAGRP
ncbi:MAG: hypothetical protein ACRD4P_10800 [Bryobacteraceae bacterium]